MNQIIYFWRGRGQLFGIKWFITCHNKLPSKTQTIDINHFNTYWRAACQQLYIQNICIAAMCTDKVLALHVHVYTSNFCTCLGVRACAGGERVEGIPNIVLKSKRFNRSHFPRSSVQDTFLLYVIEHLFYMKWRET